MSELRTIIIDTYEILQDGIGIEIVNKDVLYENQAYDERDRFRVSNAIR